MTTVNIRYMVDDVEAAIAFYTTHLGFTLISKTLPAFADIALGDLRLLLSGPTSSAGRPARRAAPCPTAASRVLAAGTVSTSSSATFRPRSIDFATSGSGFGVTS